jgi:hypothetical protein
VSRATRLGPGIYAVDGDWHVDAVEFLEAHGVEPTAENQDWAARLVERVAEEHGVPFDVEEQARR